jgi:hypothetical protein
MKLLEGFLPNISRKPLFIKFSNRIELIHDVMGGKFFSPCHLADHKRVARAF